MKVSEIPYKRVTAEEAVKTIEACILKVKAAKNAEELIRARGEFVECEKHFATMASLSFMRFTLNTRDEFYLAEREYYDEAAPQVEIKSNEFYKAFLNSPFRKDAEKQINPLVIQKYECSIKCADERIMSDMVEENKLSTEYTKLMSETKFSFQGEEMPLSKLKKYFTDRDRSVRRAAYETAGKTMDKVSDQLDGIFDRMVKVRTKMAKTLGYENFVELGDNRMGRVGYDREMISVFRENVLKDVVPTVKKLKAELKDELGISGEFMLYDNETYFKSGNPEPILQPKEMFEAAKEMYHTMGKETGEFFDMMLKNDAFDVFSRDGKWGGGYCTSFADYKQPFILANFNGSSGDVDVLTHEAGHAFADYMMYRQNHDYELNVGGMETAETHSMSMEFFCWKFIDRFFGERGEDYRYMHLFDALNFIPYGTIVDYFQQLVYEKPEMTPAERNALWLSLEKKFRPQLTSEGIPYLEKGTRWQYQMHIYENPMYYIDYCLAQSVAVQFLAESLKDYDGAFARYIKLLSQGGEKDFEGLVLEAGLKSPFKPGALAEIARDAAKVVESLKK